MRKFVRPILLAAALGAAATSASAQNYGGYPSYPPASGDYALARVIAVRPVYADGYANTNGYGANAGQQRCYSDAGNYGNNGYVGNGYNGNGYYGNNGYNNSPDNGYQRDSGMGRTMAGVVGSVLGAVVGSQVGNGSGRYIGSAVGSVVGGVAGQSVYDNARNQQRRARVTVCDPEPVGSNGYPANGYANNGYAAAAQQMYDVTYEYGGRQYTSRLPYRPNGDSIRVRVTVQPE